MNTIADTSGPPLRSVEMFRVSVPLRSLHRSRSITTGRRESVLVRVVDHSGAVGTAECPTLPAPGYATETTQEAWQALTDELAPAWLVGSRVGSPRAPAAAAAMTDALLDATLRGRRTSLADWLTPPPARARTALRWCAVIADVRASEEDVVEAARSAERSGASMLKLKFGDPEGLRSRAAAVREQVDLPIAADANGGMDAASAAKLEDLGLVYLEQPLAPSAPWEDLAELRACTSSPLCLDESLTSVDALRAAISAGALDVVSIKPARMGGIAQAAAAVRLAGTAGLRCFVGGMFELGIGRAGALCVAAMPGCALPCDLGPSARYFAEDVCAPHVVVDGGLSVPTGDGIGRVLDDAAVLRYAEDRFWISA